MKNNPLESTPVIPLENTALKSIKKLWLDLIFPAICLGCQKICPEDQSGHVSPHLCSACASDIKTFFQEQCLFCSAPSLKGKVCPFCRGEHWLDTFWASTAYDHPLLKRVIWAYKYRFVSDLCRPLGQMLINFLKNKGHDKFLRTFRSQIVLIPIPLHRRRLNWRSYNQSALLAEEVAKEFDLEIDLNRLLRLKHRSPQTEIKEHEQRLANAKDIFFCQPSPSLNQKTIILVDDVATTGSTLDEAARVFKEAGVKRVIGLVVAKG